MMQETKTTLARSKISRIEETIMARMKFICDAERCIECNGCVTACKQENEVPWGGTGAAW
jgi:Fe-S-cluster-containing dehydrogenase component